MLRTQQFLQTRIILWLLKGIVLGSMAFSLTACEQVNQIKEMLIPDQEKKAKQIVSITMGAQKYYRINEGYEKFSDSFEELGIKITPNAEKYSYQIHRGIQIDLNDYQLLTLDKATRQSLKISEQDIWNPAKKFPVISSNVVMISAQPKKAGMKTFLGFVFGCIDQSTGGSDCEHESLTFSIVYESEIPSIPLPNKLKVSLPLDFCDMKRGCLREKIPPIKGFRLVEDTNLQ
jgi:hypothetical protein